MDRPALQNLLIDVQARRVDRLPRGFGLKRLVALPMAWLSWQTVWVVSTTMSILALAFVIYPLLPGTDVVTRLVPPTEVTHSSEVGQSVCARVVFGSQFAPVAAAPGELSPQSPEEKLKPMPSTAPILKVCS